MKKYQTISDGGCFLFGNTDFSFKLPNDYGDGKNIVYVFDDENEFIEFCKTKYGRQTWHEAFNWKMMIKGTFNLYDYDCSMLEEQDVKVKLDGWYNVYLRSKEYERPTLALIKKG